MDSLVSMITKPLEAASAAIQTAAAGPAGAAIAVAPALQGNPTFTEDTLRMMLYNLFHGDSRLQQQVCQQYYAADATFILNEGLLRVQGAEQLQQLLRGLQLFARFKPEVLEVGSSMDKAIILLNLNISYKLLPLTWWFPLPTPATISLTFGKPTDSVLAASNDVITHHQQEMSLLDLVAWNPAWRWFKGRIWGPLSGRVLSSFVQWEEPLVSNHSSYLAGGAGHVQAVLWTLEDQAKAFGLQGLPSAAAKLLPNHGQRSRWRQQQQQDVVGKGQPLQSRQQQQQLERGNYPVSPDSSAAPLQAECGRAGAAAASAGGTPTSRFRAERPGVSSGTGGGAAATRAEAAAAPAARLGQLEPSLAGPEGPEGPEAPSTPTGESDSTVGVEQAAAARPVKPTPKSTVPASSPAPASAEAAAKGGGVAAPSKGGQLADMQQQQPTAPEPAAAGLTERTADAEIDKKLLLAAAD